MATILRNEDAEALLLDIRAARTAANEVLDDRAGAFLIFPTSVVTTRPDGGQLVFPLSTDIEPGTVVHDDGCCMVDGTVEGVRVTGRFSWTCSPEAPDAPPAPAGYRFRRRGRDIAPPAWTDRLPVSTGLIPQAPFALARQRTRLLRQGRAAEYWLLSLTERVVRQSCRGPLRRAVNVRAHVDVDDVVQRGMQAACRLLPVYASPGRPPCSWLGMLRLDAKRDMHREITRLDWLPPDAAVVAARAAPDAPSLTALESLPTAQLEATSARAALDTDAVDEEWGWAAAAVARLVSDDSEVVSLAAKGDAATLSHVGAQVIATFRTGRESAAATRRRCWDDFDDSGKLFDTEAGRRRFDPPSEVSLAAIDASLRQAAGRGERPAGAW